MSNNIMTINEIVEANLEFAHCVAYQVAKKYKLNKEKIEEAKSSAYVGLIEAATKYKQGKDSVPFKNFAFYRIRGAIIDSFRKDTQTTNRYAKVAKAYTSVVDFEEKVLSIEPEDKEDEKIAKVFDLVSKGALVFKLGTNEIIEDRISDSEDQSPENHYLRLEQRQILEKAIDKLSEDERHIIKEHYFKDKTFVDIAKSYKSYSRSSITRIHIKALSNLQEILKDEKEREKEHEKKHEK